MAGPEVVPSDAGPGEGTGRSAGAPDGNAYCRNCAADVTRLPPIARFCNRCGTGLPPGVASRVLPELVESPGHPAVPFARVLPPSLILLAYGKALFNLGFRYETAVGARRNADEAFRCYRKAARLGDPDAVGRLATLAATSEEVCKPPPLPTAGRTIQDKPSHPPVAPPLQEPVQHPPPLPS